MTAGKIREAAHLLHQVEGRDPEDVAVVNQALALLGQVVTGLDAISPAETEYREFVAMADQAMQNASNQDWTATDRHMAALEAQTYAALAQAAAVLMVPRPADPDVCSACGIEEVNIVNRYGRFCDQDCANYTAEREKPLG